MLWKNYVLIGLSVFAFHPTAHAQLFYSGNMNVVTASSTLTVSGNLSNAALGTTNYQQQGAGSLVASYFGTMNVAVNLGAGTIQFFAPTAVNGNNSGNWQPLPGGAAGNAQAVYGVFIPYAGGFEPINAALRSLTYSITSASLPLSGGGNSFTFTPTQQIPITSGVLDFRATGLFSGSGFTSMVGNTASNVAAANTGSVVLLPSNDLRVTFNVDATINTVFDPGAGLGNFTAQTRFVGSLQAIVAVPEPATIGLLGLTGTLAGLLLWRHLKARKRHLNAIIQ